MLVISSYRWNKLVTLCVFLSVLLLFSTADACLCFFYECDFDLNNFNFIIVNKIPTIKYAPESNKLQLI